MAKTLHKSRASGRIVKAKRGTVMAAQVRDVGPDPALRHNIAGAIRAVAAKGLFKEAGSLRISTRLPPSLVKSAKTKSGIKKDSELIKAALALMVGHDSFVTWFIENRGKLDPDFELAV